VDVVLLQRQAFSHGFTDAACAKNNVHGTKNNTLTTPRPAGKDQGVTAYQTSSSIDADRRHEDQALRRQ
jgi:hypothetical protein